MLKIQQSREIYGTLKISAGYRWCTG